MGDGAVKEILERPSLDEKVEKKEEGLENIKVMQEAAKPSKTSSYLMEMGGLAFVIEFLTFISFGMAYNMFIAEQTPEYLQGAGTYFSLAWNVLCDVMLMREVYLYNYDYVAGTNRSSL
jgi:hypothetical protein